MPKKRTVSVIIFLLSFSLPCFAQAVGKPTKSMSDVERYEKTYPYSELVNLEIPKSPFSGQGSIQQADCLFIRNNFRHDISSKWAEMNSTLSDIKRYRDEVATTISKCSGGISSEFVTCTDAQIKEAIDFSKWYFNNVHFMENLSCALNVVPFGPHENTTRSYSEDQLHVTNLNHLLATATYNKEQINIIKGAAIEDIAATSRTQALNLATALD
ncbi:MAG: hypothetical protein V1647_03670, partial [Pseudomonadota bacterium]